MCTLGIAERKHTMEQIDRQGEVHSMEKKKRQTERKRTMEKTDKQIAYNGIKRKAERRKEGRKERK